MIVPSEDDLVNRLKAHQPRAMEDLYDRYAVLVYSLARRIVGDDCEAEDIVQETFLRVWNRAHLLDPSKGNLTTWLLTITRHYAIDTIRAKRGKVFCFLRLDREFAGSLAGDVAFFYQNRVHVQRALKDLEPTERAVIELAYFEGLSQTEMAEKMNRPLGTIKTLVRTALASLRVSMDHELKPSTSSREPQPTRSVLISPR